MSKAKATCSIFSYVVDCNDNWTGDETSVYMRSKNQKRQRDNICHTYWRKYSKVENYWRTKTINRGAKYWKVWLYEENVIYDNYIIIKCLE